MQTERYDHSDMRSPLARLAYLVFLLFFFVVIFGIDMPFQEPPEGVVPSLDESVFPDGDEFLDSSQQSEGRLWFLFWTEALLSFHRNYFRC